MSNKEMAAEWCSGLHVHESDRSVQESESPKTSSANPDSSVAVTDETLPSEDWDTSHQPDPNTEAFNLDNWIYDLNRSLQDQRGNTAAQVALLTKARQFCEDHIHKLTETFLQSETELKADLKEHPKKKAQQKILRVFDPELRSVNKQVEEVKLVRKQVESLVVQLSGPDLEGQPLSPILTAAEVIKSGTARQQLGSNKFCRDLTLTVLASVLVFFLVFEIAASAPNFF
ncbi:hypothetical protein ACOMHN_041227 [Nucella lapillus]